MNHLSRCCGRIGTPMRVYVHQFHNSSCISTNATINVSSPCCLKANSCCVVVVVNPLCHINSSVICHWALSRTNTHLHLVSKYTTDFWSVLCRIAENYSCFESDPSYRLIVPLVSRHISYLSQLLIRPTGDVLLETASSTLASPSTQNLPSTSCSKFHKRFLASIASPRVVLLLGSAPVGPATLEQFQQILDSKLPLIRFGSTETALQVAGTGDLYFEEDNKNYLRALRRGWDIKRPEDDKSEETKGYYIGRCHPGLTDVCVVKSVDPSNKEEYMLECRPGEVGRLICRGGNCFERYAQIGQRPYAEARSLRREKACGHDPWEQQPRRQSLADWYLGLGDVGFYLWEETDANGSDGTSANDGSNGTSANDGSNGTSANDGSNGTSSNGSIGNNGSSGTNANDGSNASSCSSSSANGINGNRSNVKELYWCSRSSDMIIRGGVNYSCEAISVKITELLCSAYGLQDSDVAVATVGIKHVSEYDDDCCVTVELNNNTVDETTQHRIQGTFQDLTAGSSSLPKGMRPSFVRFTDIPRTFKGAPHTPTLQAEFKAFLKTQKV
eukprot:GHVS01075945.1.p1 GENE.GHVS01075945.1~~GHVS01075945.1.p1  ORF type:complete len:558 (+),score=94.93 GHVS01075945.1:735-2408(+)